MPAVVLGGAANALSISRSLGCRGIPVDVLAEQRHPLPVRHSRYCRRYVAVTSPPQEAWLEWLLAPDRPPSVVLPAGDEGIELVCHNRTRLVERGHLPVEGDDQLTLALLDKAATYRLAAQAGVAAPESVELNTLEDVVRSSGAIPYPAVVKARVSHHYLREFSAFDKARIVRDEVELVEAVEPALAAGVRMLLTELVEGPHDAYCSYYAYVGDGRERLADATKRKLRQYPIGFGEGTFHQMADEPEAAQLGWRLFESIGLKGLCNVEFKRDARDQQLKLIECNPRFTQADALLRRAGIDFPMLAYARLTGLPLPRFGPQRNGSYLWVPGNDLRALRDYRRNGEMTGSAWLRSLSRKTMTPLHDWRDVGPSARDLRRRLGRLPAKVRAIGGSPSA